VFRYRLITVTIIITIFFVLGTVSTGFAWIKTPATETFNQKNLIRLHVLANSDAIKDQSVKLKVRNRIVKVAEEILLNVTDPVTAERVIRSNLKVLEAVAQDELKKNNLSLPVKVMFGEYLFPERSYPFGVLEAGEYKGIKVVLGEGKGRNWWCVLYPPLCLLAPEAPTFTGTSTEPVKVEYRLAVLENWLKAKGIKMDRFWQGWGKFFCSK